MICCSLLVAASLSMGGMHFADGAEGAFSTPMFLRGQPVWVTRVSRRQLRAKHDEEHPDAPQDRETDVAIVLT